MTIANELYNERLGMIISKQNNNYNEIFNEITQIELKPSILVMSGGLDTTLLLYLLNDSKVPLHVISFDYGQKAVKEINFAKKHCEKLKISHETIKIEGGNLAGNLGEKGDIIHDDEVLIPARNQFFLSIAVNYALQHGYERVYYGPTKETNEVYMDCSLEFIHQFNLLNIISDLKIVQIRAPLLKYTKQDIIGLLLDYGVDLRETWSCYANEENPCGVCSSCCDRQNFERSVKEKYSKKVISLQRMLNSYNK